MVPINRSYGSTKELFTRYALTIEHPKVYIHCLAAKPKYSTLSIHEMFGFLRDTHKSFSGCHRRNLVSELLKPGSGQAIRFWHDSSVFLLYYKDEFFKNRFK